MLRLDQIVDELIMEIKALGRKRKQVLIAIDGRCAAGKTTIATEIQKKIPCNIIHMDHFFLRPEQRTSERYQMPGGNIDYERILEEVLPQLLVEGDISYRPFDCAKQTLGEKIELGKQHIVIIEGSYSCHPTLWDYYDFHCFLTVDKKEQMERIVKRNGAEKAQDFEERWIPLEEKYLKNSNWMERCETWFDTTTAL